MRGTIVAMLALAVLAACTKVGTQDAGGAVRHNAWTQPHVLRYGDVSDIPTLNPHLYAGFTVNFLSEMVMAYLVKYDHDNKPVPELITEIPTLENGGISNDGLTITYHLRKEVKWSDGRPFDADDVVFSFNVVNNPKNNEISRDGFDLITKIDEPDKYTVVLHLKKRYSPFVATFFGTAGANPCILPKHILGNLPDINHAPYNSLPVGIGPFKVVEWQRGDHVLLEANPLYFRGRPKLDKVIFKIVPDSNTLLTLLQTGQVDLWPLLGTGFYQRARALKGITVIHHAGFGFTHIDFNVTHPVVAEQAVRHALRLATNRQEIRDKVGHGLGILQEGVESPSNAVGYDPALPFEKFSIAKANAILDAAGWVRGADGIRAKNGVRLSLSFASTAGTPDTDTRIELMRASWQQVGAELVRKDYPPSLLFAQAQDGGILDTGKYDAATFSWYTSAVPDLSNLYECDQKPPAGENSLFWCDAATDRALQAFKATYDPAQQKKDDAIVQERIYQEVPSFVLYIAEDVYGFNSDLKGYNPNSVSPFDNMMDVDI